MTERVVPVHPVQLTCCYKSGALSTSVTMRAYEVYCALYSPQEAMVTGSCRGGFSYGELIAFLYAHSFPKEEWRQRTMEAMDGMKFPVERHT